MWLEKPEMGVAKLKELELPDFIRKAVNGHRLSANRMVTFLCFQADRKTFQSGIGIREIKKRLKLEVEPILARDRCEFSANGHGPGPPTIDRLLPDELIPSRRQIQVELLVHLYFHLLIAYALAWWKKPEKNKKRDIWEKVIVSPNEPKEVWAVVGEPLKLKRLRELHGINVKYLLAVMRGENCPPLDLQMNKYFIHEIEEEIKK